MDTSTGLEALKTALATDNRYAGWCTIAVFVGLIFEYVIEMWLKREDLSWREIVLTLAAGVVIAGGVYGEYHYGSSAAGVTDQIENISERQVAASNAGARQAEQRTAELQASIADRHLTSDQRKQMAAILRGLPGTKVMVTYLTNAADDAQEYATEIGSVFRDLHGWSLAALIPGVFSDQTVHGFAIQSQSEPISKLQEIEKALAVTGYKVTRWPTKQGPAEIDIYVGRK